MGIPGENLNGVYSANEFLTRVNLMRAYEFPHVRHAGVARTQGRGRGRGQRGDGCGAHRPETRRRGGLPRVSADRGRDAGTRRGDPSRASRRASSSRCSARRSRSSGRDGWVTGMIATSHGAHRARRERPARAGVRDGLRLRDRVRHGDHGGGHAREPAAARGGPRLSSSPRAATSLTDEDGATNLPGVYRRRRHRHRGGDRHPGDGRGQDGRSGDGRVAPRAVETHSECELPVRQWVESDHDERPSGPSVG